MVDFSEAPGIYWSDCAKISYLQRRILVYSIMYYEHDESCVSDYYYDSIARQLGELVKECDPEEFKKTTYYYCMYDFDGSSTSGFHLCSRLTEQDKKYLCRIASMVHKSWRKKKEC